MTFFYCCGPEWAAGEQPKAMPPMIGTGATGRIGSA
jgi:hypothetical protein